MADENESKDETSSEATKKVTIVIMNISTVYILYMCCDDLWMRQFNN